MAQQAVIVGRPAAMCAESPVSVDGRPLWVSDFAEVTGHNLEARGRKVVNRLLEVGWRLLHIHTLRYEERGVWRERPMAILGRLRTDSTIEGENGNALKKSASEISAATPAKTAKNGAQTPRCGSQTRVMRITAMKANLRDAECATGKTSVG
jgi:hypothetical protein